MNSVVLIGRLTNVPELRTSSNGKNVARFTLAVNGYGEHTDFINCVVWEKQADNLCKYCTKGSQVGVQGRIQTGSYDKQDGTKVYTTDILVNQVMFLGKKEENKQTDQLADFSNDIELTDDYDLPF